MLVISAGQRDQYAKGGPKDLAPPLSEGLDRAARGMVGSGPPPPPDWAYLQVSHQDLPFLAPPSCPVVRRRVKGEAPGHDLSPFTPSPSVSSLNWQDDLSQISHLLLFGLVSKHPPSAACPSPRLT